MQNVVNFFNEKKCHIILFIFFFIYKRRINGQLAPFSQEKSKEDHVISKFKSCEPSKHALLENRLKCPMSPKYSPIVDDSVDVPTSDSVADVNGSPVKIEPGVILSGVSGVDDMINMASTVNRDFLDSEFQVLNELIDSMRVDLLQTSIPVTYLQDYLKAMVRW